MQFSNAFRGVFLRRAGPPLSAGPQKGKSPLSLCASERRSLTRLEASQGLGEPGQRHMECTESTERYLGREGKSLQSPLRVVILEASGTKTDGVEIDWMPEEFHVGRVCLVDAAKNVRSSE